MSSGVRQFVFEGYHFHAAVRKALEECPELETYVILQTASTQANRIDYQFLAQLQGPWKPDPAGPDQASITFTTNVPAVIFNPDRARFVTLSNLAVFNAGSVVFIWEEQKP